jgi:hypothetical protein
MALIAFFAAAGVYFSIRDNLKQKGAKHKQKANSQAKKNL